MQNTLRIFTTLIFTTFACLAISSPLVATTLNFDTHANGTPFTIPGDIFPSTEYSGLGVTINDSDPDAGLTNVAQSNPLNIATPISGFYLFAGAFPGLNFVDFSFGPSVLNVGFDFATFSGKLHILAYDAANAEIYNANVLGVGSYILPSNFTIHSGSAVVSGVGAISRVRLEGAIDEGVIMDNLNFTPSVTNVPEPASLGLLTISLLGLGVRVRRRYQ